MVLQLPVYASEPECVTCHWTAGCIGLCEHILTVGCWGGGGGGGGGILTGGAEGL